MNRKVKKYAGGNLVDSSGNPVRSSSGEPVRTRFGKDEEERPKAGADDYATMGKRAGATSTMSGPKEYITESIKEDTEKESPRGIASGFSAEKYLEESGTKGGGSGVYSKTGPEKKKPKPKPRYSDVVSSKDLGSQDFSSRAKPASSTGGSGLSKAALAAGLGLGAAAGAGALASRRQMKSGSRSERIEPTMSTSRSPVRNISPEEAAFENEGGRYFKKGGATKKMASGGKVSSASNRGDGIAQRGKTKGRMC